MKTKIRLLIPTTFLPFIVLGTIILVLILYRPSHSAANGTFTVNSADDTDDGTCDGTHCSLREAINAANIATGNDAIEFSLLPSATITLAGAQLPTITDTLTIDGSTAVSLTISGDNLTRSFNIGSGTAVTLTTLTIKDGRAGYGGAIYNDGGNLTLLNSTLKGNFALIGGGGVYNDSGTLLVMDSDFHDNTSEISGGAILTFDSSSTTISNTVFLGNTAEVTRPFPSTSGGAIANHGTMTIINSTFTNNGALAFDDPYDPTFSADSRGGGIENYGTLSIYGSTFNNNLSFAVAPYIADTPNHYSFGSGSIYYSSSGGGIANYGLLTISNSTFSGNRADVAMTFQNNTFSGSAASGGGLANNDTMTITNSTLTGNTTTVVPTSGPPEGGGGGGIENSGTMTLKNTIIANSDDSDDCLNSGIVLMNVSNLVEDGSCSPTLTGDPLLGPLQDNGGPTLTHALTSPSPALDSGDDSSCAAPPVNNLDQRGVTRPLDGNGDGTLRCDIGAYEYDGPPPDRFYLPGFFHN